MNNDETGETFEFSNLKISFDNAYEARKKIVIEPLRKKYMNATNINITVDEMLQKFNYDLDKTKKYYTNIIIYNLYKNLNPDEKFLQYDIFKENFEENEEGLDSAIKKMKEQLDEKNKIVNNILETDLTQQNKDNKDSPSYVNITKDDINRLCKNQKDVELISKIMSKIDEYNRKLGTNVNIKNVEQLCDNPRNFDWTTVYLKV